MMLHKFESHCENSADPRSWRSLRLLNFNLIPKPSLYLLLHLARYTIWSELLLLLNIRIVSRVTASSNLVVDIAQIEHIDIHLRRFSCEQGNGHHFQQVRSSIETVGRRPPGRLSQKVGCRAYSLTMSHYN